MRLLIAIACCVMLELSALAQPVPQYLVFAPGQTTAPQVLTLSDPNSPPNGGTAFLWTVQNSDRDASHYSLSGSTVVYAAPAAPTIVNPLAAELAIQADTNISIGTQKILLGLKSVLDTYAASPQGAKNAWQLITATEPTMTGEEIALIEQHCADNGVPLI